MIYVDMRKIFIVMMFIIVGIISYFLLTSSCLSRKSIPVNSSLFGSPIYTNVDDELAKLMLTNPLDTEVKRLFKAYDAHELDTKTLSEISNTYSTDVATLYFLKRTYQIEINKIAQEQYLKFYNQQFNKDDIELSRLNDYHVIFIPGLAYKEDNTTGADFARQRFLLEEKGISNELIETLEWGLVEQNALIIVDRLKELSSIYNNLIIVSASKGSLETAIALGKILTPNETKSIKSWISVGGILRGSPIADNYLKAPNCWFAEFMLWTKSKKIDIVQDLSYEKRNKDFSNFNFPEHIKIIHFVGAPLASQISKDIKGRYCSMKKLGPNDGLTPIADEITKQGIIISELGLDHYFKDRNIDKKTLALALVATTGETNNKKFNQSIDN